MNGTKSWDLYGIFRDLQRSSCCIWEWTKWDITDSQQSHSVGNRDLNFTKFIDFFIKAPVVHHAVPDEKTPAFPVYRRRIKKETQTASKSNHKSMRESPA
jgi:hypothetical protein